MAEITVSVFGTSRAQPGQPAYAVAEQLGQTLAEAGFVVANGGYGGTMLATAKGAVKAGGTVIGVTCSAFKNSVANEYVTREVVTDSLDKRLATLVEMGQAYVVLPGGTGTLLELAMVWELKNKRFLDQARAIVLLGGFWQPLVDLIARDDPRSTGRIALAQKPSEAVEHIKKTLGPKSGAQT
ncbi:MAG: LOG family protein [Planctomycetota bacterium]|jgi:uncharacterized protein (TIGR00730 family)